MGYNERKKEQEAQVRSLLSPSKLSSPKDDNEAIAKIMTEAVKSGQIGPAEAIAGIKAIRGSSETSTTKNPPAGGYGRENLSSLYSQLFNAPLGTGKIQGQDPGGGVIRKVSGKPSADPLGYGEGNVYVPGRNMSYEIRTPEDYKRSRDDFIKETQAAGSIPGQVQDFAPQKSLLTPGPTGASIMATEASNRQALKSAGPLSPAVPPDAAIMATENANRSALKPKPSFNTNPAEWARSTISEGPSPELASAAAQRASSAPQPGESILDAQRRNLGASSLLQAIFKTKNPWDWKYGFGDKPRPLSPVTSRRNSLLRMR